MLTIVMFVLLVLYLTMGTALAVFCIQMIRWETENAKYLGHASEASILSVSSRFVFFILVMFGWPIGLLMASFPKHEDERTCQPSEPLHVPPRLRPAKAESP